MNLASRSAAELFTPPGYLFTGCAAVTSQRAHQRAQRPLRQLIIIRAKCPRRDRHTFLGILSMALSVVLLFPIDGIRSQVFMRVLLSRGARFALAVQCSIPVALFSLSSARDTCKSTSASGRVADGLGRILSLASGYQRIARQARE